MYAVMHWHYSRKMPIGKLVKFGVWEHDQFIGAVIFGRGANFALGKPYGLRQTEVCELVRVALRAHEAPVTEVVARAVQMLRQEQQLRLIVSFADQAEGHLGVIYQAGNWVYLGETTPVPGYKDVATGTVHHHRVVTGKSMFGRANPMYANPNLVKVQPPPKHRYALPLDRAMRRQLAPMARPYPKAR